MTFDLDNLNFFKSSKKVLLLCLMCFSIISVVFETLNRNPNDFCGVFHYSGVELYYCGGGSCILLHSLRTDNL